MVPSVIESGTRCSEEQIQVKGTFEGSTVSLATRGFWPVTDTLRWWHSSSLTLVVHAFLMQWEPDSTWSDDVTA